MSKAKDINSQVKHQIFQSGPWSWPPGGQKIISKIFWIRQAKSYTNDSASATFRLTSLTFAPAPELVSSFPILVGPQRLCLHPTRKTKISDYNHVPTFTAKYLQEYIIMFYRSQHQAANARVKKGETYKQTDKMKLLPFLTFEAKATACEKRRKPRKR